MKKTILLGTVWNWSNDTLNLWVTVLGGFFMGLNGINLVSWGNLPGYFFGIPAIAFSTYGYLSHHKSSKYAPRFSFDEKEISFKETIEKPLIAVPWDHIKKIKLSSLRLNISTVESEMAWGYMTSDKTSNEIKSAIKEIAKSKNIKVVEA